MAYCAEWFGQLPCSMRALLAMSIAFLYPSYSFADTSLPASGTPAIVINEINYNSPDDFDPEDWIELYNNGAETADLSGWVFKDEDEFPFFTFPDGARIEPDGYVVVCRDTALFSGLFPEVKNVLGNFGFGLSGGGEVLRLYDRRMAPVDSLFYDDKAPWPSQANGHGATLVLMDALLDNTLHTSWKPSDEIGGTPGRPNNPRRGRIVINEFSAQDTHGHADPQGGYDDWIEVYNLGDEPVALGDAYLTDDLAQPRKWPFPDTTLSVHGYLVVWADGGEGNPSGLHASFRLAAEGEQIGLFDTDTWGNTPLDTLTFGPQQNDRSMGRVPNGTGPFQAQAIPTPGAVNPAGPADFDGSGAVDFQDFLLFAQHFGSQQGYPDFDAKYDFDANGAVDFQDFLRLVQSIGTAAR